MINPSCPEGFLFVLQGFDCSSKNIKDLKGKVNQSSGLL